ncbi:GcrA family cell cycle regulator [Candidatus Endowatersipora endosymbiont of Watersipora subatra]|uniref:GcrA family cell cycle regulator n=1 Tax=Candidatus Endowatersipora endosymbiont of Watersipora subatra TaxID=3077946 RepID=UPI00312C8358
MSWTDEKVTQLSRLWADGFSASEIASELGGGITRNAVIGKVYRLGLSSRTHSSTSDKPKSYRKQNKPGLGDVPCTLIATRKTHHKVEVTTLKMVSYLDEIKRVKPSEDIVIPISRQLELLQLTESTCRWPTGDPMMPGFSFCGHQTSENKPYCTFHSKLAFQTTSERPRRH